MQSRCSGEHGMNLHTSILKCEALTSTPKCTYKKHIGYETCFSAVLCVFMVVIHENYAFNMSRLYAPKAPLPCLALLFGLFQLLERASHSLMWLRPSVA